ncbi:hypothetical protein [Chondromyces apiculatus]|uniref:Uncharacterized protein n=1 Tax=Chondromyces apiculatus DSM 436 TaxID=1192034 RepID=A0A017TIC1_9BACT|nr:hypothetical protein [Chondromyces apiculatus]EYF08627.1 Hypothetical protein CAP_4157 [Chondromyces apiculatus DSM 436]
MARSLDEALLDLSAVDALPDTARRAIARHWARRVASESRVSCAFAQLAPWLRALSAEEVVVALVARAAEDERRHAAICKRLAEVYAGAPVEAPVVEDAALPSFGCADERLEVALHVAGLCCINETIATAWIGECLAGATVPLAVAANQAHLREEIDHARIGWAYLGGKSLPPGLREMLAERVVKLLRANVPQWEAADQYLPGEGLPAHGCPDEASSRRAVHAAVEGLVLPGFAHVGLDVRGAGAWWEERGRQGCPSVSA